MVEEVARSPWCGRHLERRWVIFDLAKVDTTQDTLALHNPPRQ